LGQIVVAAARRFPVAIPVNSGHGLGAIEVCKRRRPKRKKWYKCSQMRRARAQRGEAASFCAEVAKIARRGRTGCEKGPPLREMPERHPAGAKARLFFCATCATTKVVPFQNCALVAREPYPEGATVVPKKETQMEVIENKRE
jgi:hypothetical protein